MAQASTVIEDRENGTPDPAQSQAQRLAAISAERQTRIGATAPNKGESFVAAQSRGRQQASGATAPNEGESFVAAQSRGREARIANRADFNAPSRTDQQGNRTAVSQATGSEGQTFTARPQKDIRDMLERGGPRGDKEERRFSQWEGTSSGKNFNFGNFQSSIAKVRRGALGQKEWDRQMDVAFNSQPLATSPQSPISTSQPSNANGEPIAGSEESVFIDPDPTGDVTDAVSSDNTIDTSTETAMVDTLDTIESSLFDIPDLNSSYA